MSKQTYREYKLRGFIFDKAEIESKKSNDKTKK